MSIDERLRAGLRTLDDEPADHAALLEGWADVEARVASDLARDRARWAVGIAAAVVLLAAAAVTWWPHDGGDVQPIGPPPGPSETTPAPPALEGTWTTGPVRAQGIVDRLDAAGFGEWSEAVLQDVPAGATIAYDLKIQAGRFSITRAVGDDAADQQDYETYVVSGAQVEIKPDGIACSTVLDWQVDGEQLRFRVVSDTCPKYRGTPDRAFMESLYGAYPFTPLNS